MRNQWCTSLFLGLCCVVLTLLWLPGVRFPVISDTFTYIELGRSFWQDGTYMIGGAPYAKHLPLYPILAFPLTVPLGLHLGMHVASLLSGFAVLIAAYALARQVAPKHAAGRIPALVTVAVLVHPGFVLMSMLGSADLLFAALFLLSLYAYLRAEHDGRWYLAAGAVAGLACLTRYNGLPLFPLFGAHALLWRRAHLRDGRFWGGMGLGIAIFGIWLVRNWVAFGSPLYTDYGTELQREAPHPVLTLLSNLRYYLNPVHNLFPFFFVFALPGLWVHARREKFLLLAMLAAWLVSSVWHVQGIRFFFPGFVILLYFSALGILDALRRFRGALPVILLAGVAVQSVSLCLYSYGACNAWFDRTIGLVPANMHLSSEGLYAWDLARRYLNQTAESGAVVRYETSEAEGLFRADLRPTNDPAACPAYRITQMPAPGIMPLFRTVEEPVTSVIREECAQ